MTWYQFTRSGQTWSILVLFLVATSTPFACGGDRFQKADGETGGDDGSGGSSGTAGSGTGGRSSGGSPTIGGTSGTGTSTGGSGNDGSGGSGNEGGDDTSGGSGNDNSGGSIAGAGGSRGGSAGTTGDGGSSAGKAGSAGRAGDGGRGGGGGSGSGGFAGAGGMPDYPSCLALHAAEPGLPSGSYPIRPSGANAAFPVYCEMTTQGGGWSLAFNQGVSFAPTEEGSLTSVCYTDACTNRSYSTVPIGEDVMFDFDTLPISGNVYLARAVIVGVHSQSRGRTLRTLMTTGPAYLESEDNSNVSLTINDARGCAALPGEFAFIVCNECDDPSGDPCGVPVLTLGDGDSLCDSVKFAIGASRSYTMAWGNCSGWPPGPSWGLGGYPAYFRMWVR